MKNSWVTKAVDEFTGMNSNGPADRIDVHQSKLLENGHVDIYGRVRKQRGTTVVTFGDSLRLVAGDPRAVPRSIHTYQGRNGENPSSRLFAVVGSSLLRSKADDLRSAFDLITFPATMGAPALDLPCAGVFRQKDFYHQNGLDMPFKVASETDDGSAPSAQAVPLGLVPPAYCCGDIAANGVGTRFPVNRAVGYCMTFVYGDRGESGPSPVAYVQYTATGVEKFDLRNPQPAPSGVTARRFYRTLIGRTQVTTNSTGTTLDAAQWERPASAQEMYLLYEDTSVVGTAITSFSDDKNDSSLDFGTPVPPSRPFPPISKYQVFHLDRIFWSNVREHPWVAQIVSPTKYGGNSLVSSTITISNTGNGTISLAANDGSARTYTVSNYKTKTLRAIEQEINASYVIYNGSTASQPTAQWWIMKCTAGIDLDRTYTFKEVTSQSILSSAGPYQLIAIDDTTTYGLRWFPNRTWFSDIAFPEQVSAFNSFDLTSEGSKKITGAAHSEIDGSLVLFTEDRPFIVSGDFVPSLDTGVPVFRIDPAIASVGNICYRPDAIASTDIGIFFVGYDGLRLFRGERSEPAGREVQNYFRGLLRNPVWRDQLAMHYYGGKLRIALHTDEVP